jgi:methyl acetate hydrolase
VRRREEGVTGASEADRALARAVEDGRVPGVVALAADDRGLLYEGAFGERTLGQGAAMTLDTVFGIASMTKPVTAVAAMQLVEQGAVDLDEPVGRHLPELAAVQVLEGFDAAGAPRLRPPRRPITLRHLLTHTAGFGYAIWAADLVRYQRHLGAPPPLLETPMLFDPGDRWEYGTSVDWAGRLVERLSGQSLEHYFRAHVFDRLGMVDTTYLPGAERLARRATRHVRQSDGSLEPAPTDPPPARPAVYSGGGGLYSTGPDYLRFLRMLLGGGQLGDARVLPAETVLEIVRNQIGDLDAGRLTSASPAASNDIDLFPGMDQRWGLAGLINVRDLPGGRSAGSWAWAGLLNTYFWVDPSRRVAGLLLTQILPFGDRAVLDLLAEFERAVYALARPG